jgi:hypothetical protein
VLCSVRRKIFFFEKSKSQEAESAERELQLQTRESFASTSTTSHVSPPLIYKTTFFDCPENVLLKAHPSGT